MNNNFLASTSIVLSLVFCQQMTGNFAINQSIAKSPAQETASDVSMSSSDTSMSSGVAVNVQGRDGDFDQHYQLAHQYLFRADLNLAELEMKQAISVKPGSKVGHRFYCLISLLRFNIGQAIAEFMMTVGFGQAIPLTVAEQDQLNSICSQAHYRKGLAYEKQSRFAKAISEFTLANCYVPNNALIYRSIAFSLGKCGQFAQAEKFYQASFKISPIQAVEDAYAHADYAYLLANVNKKDEAILQLDKAVEIAPEAAALHVDLARFLEKKGNIEQAVKEMQAAIKTAPNHANVTERIGKPRPLYGVRRPPSYANLWVQLGRLLDKENKLTQAKETYQYVLLLDPQNDEVKARLHELQSTNPPDYATSAVAQGMERQS